MFEHLDLETLGYHLETLGYLLETLGYPTALLIKRFSRGFRKVFARFSRGFRFKNIFVKGSLEQRKKFNQFLRAVGAPAPRRRRTGAPAARKNW